jgi:hypothetical protein
LGKLDANRDGWIDHNDPLFEALKVRHYVGGQATDESLAEAGVAAIGLKSLAAGGVAMDEMAQIDSLGVFRRTDGSLGLVADVRLGRTEDGGG